MNRRELVGFAGAAGALAWCGGLLKIPAARESPAAPFAAAIFDERYNDAREFVQELHGRGTKALATQRDVSRLWSCALDALGGASVRALAGFTPHSDFLLMADWGASRNLRVLYLGMHDSRASGVMCHRFRLPAELSQRLRSLNWNQAGWAAMLAHHLAVRTCAGAAEYPFTLATRQRPGRDFPGTLVSWVIA